MTRVPYKDVVQAATDLSAGQIQFLLSSYAVVRAAAESGRIRILAINCRERASFAPDIPTIHEAGFPSLNVETTAGFYGPRGMAHDLRERIAKDVIAVVAEPESPNGWSPPARRCAPAVPTNCADAARNRPSRRRRWRRRWG